MKDLTLEQLTFAHFSGLLNSRFRVRAGDGIGVELELIEAVRDAAAAGGHADTFSLLFNGPVHPMLSQRIHRFEHDAVGRFDLFIVPVGCNPGGIQYQAIFNRLTKPA